MVTSGSDPLMAEIDHMRWSPGDVAEVLNKHGVWNTAICTVGLDGFTWRFGVALTEQPVEGSEARRLVVIDPEDGEQVERLRDLLLAADVNCGAVKVADYTDGPRDSNIDWGAAFADKVQRALRDLAGPAQTLEPPGLGAVVRDADGALWVKWSTLHRADRNWKRHDDHGGNYLAWSDLPDVTEILSEGVEAS